MAGLPARPPMERLIRIICALSSAPEQGRGTDELAFVAGWADAADRVSQLLREFKQIRELGWEVENVADEGSEARYRLRAFDARLRLQLTERQRTELRRAAILASRTDIADRLGLDVQHSPIEVAAAYGAPTSRSGALDTILNALRIRATVRFRYKGTDRVVHPGAVRTQNTKWYLLASEDGAKVKQFVIERMSDVRMDGAHTAVPVEVERISLHPMRWEIDPPVDVTLRVARDYVPDVRRWLMEPTAEETVRDAVHMTYRATNHEALRARIYLLASRVEVVGPEDFRKAMLEELTMMAGV